MHPEIFQIFLFWDAVDYPDHHTHSIVESVLTPSNVIQAFKPFKIWGNSQTGIDNNVAVFPKPSQLLDDIKFLLIGIALSPTKNNRLFIQTKSL